MFTTPKGVSLRVPARVTQQRARYVRMAFVKAAVCQHNIATMECVNKNVHQIVTAANVYGVKMALVSVHVQTAKNALTAGVFLLAVPVKKG